MGAAAPTHGSLLSVATMNVQGLTRNMWGTEADTLVPLLSGLCRRGADVVCLQELGLLSSDVAEFQSRCSREGYVAFVAPLREKPLASPALSNCPTDSPPPSRAMDERRVLGRGTALLFRKSIANYAALVPCFSSHRAVAVRLLIRNVCRLVFLGLYAPTGSSSTVSAERRVLLAGIRGVAAEAVALSAHLVVLGDLNEVADSSLDAVPSLLAPRATPVIDLLSGPLALRDTFRVAHPQDAVITWHPPGGVHGPRRLDYIYAHRGVSVEAAAVEPTNPLIKTDHGVVSCVLRLSKRLPPVATTHSETLLDPSRTLAWGIEGRAACVVMSTSPPLTQRIWDALVPLFHAALSPLEEPQGDARAEEVIVRDAARMCLSVTFGIRMSTVEVRVDHRERNAAVVALILSLNDRVFAVADTSYSVQAVTSTGWAAFTRTLGSPAMVSSGEATLRDLRAGTSPAVAKQVASDAMGSAFDALADTVRLAAYSTVATRQTGTHRHTQPKKQSERRALQSSLRQLHAMLSQAVLAGPDSPALASARLMHRRQQRLRRELPAFPSASADASVWAAFRSAVDASLAGITETIRTVGRVERRDLKRRAARQRRADFMAANYRAFLDSAEERQHAHGGITSVTVLDDAGLPTVSTDPDTVRRETRDFMSNWTRERRPPPSDVDALSGPAALIHTSQELRSTHPEVAAVLAPLPWVQRDWFAGLRAEPTQEEFEKLLEEAPSKTAPGPSQLSYDLLKHLPPGPWRDVVRELVCAALRHCVLPPPMKLASIWLIPKTSEPSPPPERCRPISLLEVLLKLTEALPVRRLQRALRQRGILCPLQYGFSGGGNTTAPLHVLAAAISHALETNSALDVALADSKQAFDRPPPWAQRAALARIGLPEDDIAFFSALQDGAESIVQTAYGATEPYLVCAGFRQGSLFGPTGFNIFQDPLLQMQSDSGVGYPFQVHPHPASVCRPDAACVDSVTTVPVLAYADDTTNLARGSAAIHTLVSNHVKFNSAMGGELHPAKSDYSFIRPGWAMSDYESHAARFSHFVELRNNGRSEPEARTLALAGWDQRRLGDFPWPPFADVEQRHHFNLVPMYQAMKSLGCWFSLDGSTTHQERVLRETVDLFCSRAQRKRHSIFEMRYLVSTVLLPRIVYAARVQLPPPTFLRELDAMVAETVIKSCNLSPSTAHSAIFSPAAHGLPSIASAATAAAIDDVYTLLSDDWSAENRVLRAEDAVRCGGGPLAADSLRRAERTATLQRVPQTALTARLQSIAAALALPGNPLSYPFHKSMLRSVKAPYLVRVWEAMSAAGYELHSRLPGLRGDPRCMLADVLPQASYQRIARSLTCRTGSPNCPRKPLWTVSDVVRADGLGLRSIRELVPAAGPVVPGHGGEAVGPGPRRSGDLRPSDCPWYSTLCRGLGYGTVRTVRAVPSAVGQLSHLQPGKWRVGLDRMTHSRGDVVTVWRPQNQSWHFALRVFLVRAVACEGAVVGLSELMPVRGHTRWRLPADGEPVPPPPPLSLRDVGLLSSLERPPEAAACALDLLWLHRTDLFPLVGGWMSAEDAEEDGMEDTWLVPHPTAWLEDAYDGESQRRSEHLARVAASDDHPIRCIRAALAARETQPLLPTPLTFPVAVAESGADAAAVPPARAFSVSVAGAAPQAPGPDGPLGAAATYCAGDDASPDGRFVELSSRLDRGSRNSSSASAAALCTAAELHGVVLAARVAAAHRELASEVLINVSRAHVPGALERLRTAPIDRRRIASGASDASNFLQAYGLLQQSLCLPSLKVSLDQPAAGMGRSTVFRAERAAHVECLAGRDFPLGSDWCIVEHEGERVFGRVKDHFLHRAASEFTLALSRLASQGRVLRHAPDPLPPSRSQALLRLRKGPVGAARSAARSLTSTHVTRRELRRWSPATHASDGCWLPGCSESTPDSQDHALLDCPSTVPERVALLDELRAALRRAGPQNCHYWLALTSGPRIGADRARIASLGAFASTGVAAATVEGVPLALIRRHADDPTAAEHPTLGAVVRRTAATPPPATTTRALLSSWCAAARDEGHRWIAIPEKILHNCVFRWQAADNRSPDELLESIAAAAVAQNHSFARLWSTLHHSATDIIQDSFGVTACLSTCALTAPRRSAAVVLAPGLPATPLDPLLCCHSWSPRALSDAAANHGLLALLPHASAPGAGEAYAALTSRIMPVTAAGDGARVVLLVPWDAPGAPSADGSQNAAVASLFRKGFIPVAVLPPQLVPVFHLEAFGAGLFEQRSAVPQRRHLLLTSWLPPADQLAGALVALGTLAQLRNGPIPSPPPAHLPWLLERCAPPQDASGGAARRDVTWSLRLGIVNPHVTSVVGAPDYVDSVLGRAAALLALPPDEFLLPLLHHPLPAGAPAAPPCHPQSYLGAALDDDDQPEPPATRRRMSSE